MSKKHTPEQIIRKLREAEAEQAGGATIAHVCQKLGVSEPTFHRWRAQYGGMKADEAERLGLIPGQQVRVEAAQVPAERFLFAGTEANPPFVWLMFHPLAARHVA